MSLLSSSPSVRFKEAFKRLLKDVYFQQYSQLTERVINFRRLLSTHRRNRVAKISLGKELIEVAISWSAGHIT